MSTNAPKPSKTDVVVDDLNAIGNVLDAVAGLKPSQISGFEVAAFGAAAFVLHASVPAQEQAAIVGAIAAIYMVVKALDGLVHALIAARKATS